MILDYMTRIEQYNGVCPHFVEALRFAASLGNCELGRYEQDDYFAMVQQLETRFATGNDFEMHHKYADVHIVLEGEEVLEYEDIANLNPIGEFNETRDIQMLEGTGQTVVIRAGMFCATFPHDGHKPGCCVEAPATLKKIVLKVPV